MTSLTQILNIQHPIIMAPMFLVSNVDMVIAAHNSGITGCIPAHNFRSLDQYREALLTLKNKGVCFGVNIIVNRSNRQHQQQIKIACDEGCDYIITSLGNPKEAITSAHAKGIKVFCDVTTLEHAQKVQSLGADGVIAVGSDAGGHLGGMPVIDLVKHLQNHLDIPIIAAGGVGDYSSYQDRIQAGACGVSVGTVFIASTECQVQAKYKQAIVEYGEDDIVITSRLSGTPCTVINTPTVQNMSLNENFLEKFLNKNKRLKRLIKSWLFVRGFALLQKSAFDANYKSVWCAGKSIKFVSKIRPVSEIVHHIITKAKD